MRGRRSSRSAAVVLAGCVGLAVMAPGLALAAPVPSATTEAECEAVAGNTWIEGVGCDDGTTSTTTTTTDASGSGSAASSGSSTSSGSTGAGTGTTANTDGGGAAGTPAGTPGTGTATGTTGTATGTENTEDDGTETGTGTTADPATAPVPPAEPISTAALAEGVAQLQAALNEDLLEDLPLADLLPLPDLPDIPQPDADGNFENVNAACLNAISQLQFPTGTEGLDVLSQQLQGFCEQLDPTTLTDLLDSLLELLNGLIPSLPEAPGTIPTEAPSYVPANYWGYWHKQYDVDCPELTYDEANAILAWDRSDPFRLDRDDDGEACEGNAHGDDVEYVEYIGYPVGGVATGDGSTGSGASGVEVALAAGVLSGLGVTGLALVRRFARQG